MKDNHNQELYVGDIIKLDITGVGGARRDGGYDVGRIEDIRNFKTGYMSGGYISGKYISKNWEVWGDFRITNTKENVLKLSSEEAMLWKLENE